MRFCFKKCFETYTEQQSLLYFKCMSTQNRIATGIIDYVIDRDPSSYSLELSCVTTPKIWCDTYIKEKKTSH